MTWTFHLDLDNVTSAGWHVNQCAEIIIIMRNFLKVAQIAVSYHQVQSKIIYK